jgi:hypothetical protein
MRREMNYEEFSERLDYQLGCLGNLNRLWGLAHNSRNRFLVRIDLGLKI